MKVKNLVLCAGALATASAMAAPRQLQTAEWNGITLRPTHMAPIYMVDGVEVRGEVQAVSEFGERLDGYLLTWDSFQGDQTVATDFPPVGGNLGPCSLAASSRYYFGTGAANVDWCNDFAGQAAAQTGSAIRHARVAWFFNPIVAEPWSLDMFWFNEFNGTCAFPFAGTDSINAARGFIVGYRFIFAAGGTVAPQPAGYFTVALTINAPPATANMPDSDGAYRMRSLRGNPTGAPVNADFSTRSQPMIWGTQGDANPAFPPYAGQPRPGAASNIVEWDDDGGAAAPAQPPILADNRFENDPAAPLGIECYSYAFGLCYNPLGALAGWFKQSCTLPPAFNLLSPADGATCMDLSSNINFSWEVSNPAPSSYTLEISKSADMSSPVHTQANLLLDNTDVPGGTLCGSGFFWRVTANSGAGCPGRLSAVRSFFKGANFNGDDQVDFFDYLDFAQAFSNEAPAADYNCDGQIDFFDYLDFANSFSQCS